MSPAGRRRPRSARTLTFTPVPGLPEVDVGADLAALIAERADLADGDVVCVAHKIVSKAEGALVDLDPTEETDRQRRRLALQQARRVVARAPWVVITETPHGLVCANGGLDASNAPRGQLVALPDDPDASARRLREGLRSQAHVDVAVVITDTFGRPWRLGQTDVAIGCAGLDPRRDERGSTDRRGQRLGVTEAAVADAIAAAADLLRTKDAGLPVVVVRGLPGVGGAHGPGAAALRRPLAEDLFVHGKGTVADGLAEPPAEPPRGEPVPDADLRRASRAATTLGATIVALPAAAAPTRLRVQAARPDVAGCGAAMLVAGLLDLGHRARLLDRTSPTGDTGSGPEWHRDRAVAVVEAAAGPAPQPGH